MIHIGKGVSKLGANQDRKEKKNQPGAGDMQTETSASSPSHKYHAERQSYLDKALRTQSSHLQRYAYSST